MRRGMTLNDAMLAFPNLVSGNYFAKFDLLCRALGLTSISESSFLHFQKHCAAPILEEVQLEMNRLIKSIFKGVPLWRFEK